MPIYAYRCAVCGHAKDVLRKISDPVLTVCPACGAASFQKQVTAAGFQLKGSGWYVTDFRGDGKAGKDGTVAGKDGGKDGAGAQADSAAKAPEAKPAAPAAPESASGSVGTASAAPAAKPPAPASSGSGAGGQ